MTLLASCRTNRTCRARFSPLAPRDTLTRLLGPSGPWGQITTDNNTTRPAGIRYSSGSYPRHVAAVAAFATTPTRAARTTPVGVTNAVLLRLLGMWPRRNGPVAFQAAPYPSEFLSCYLPLPPPPPSLPPLPLPTLNVYLLYRTTVSLHARRTCCMDSSLSGCRAALPAVQILTMRCLLLLVMLLGARVVWTVTLMVRRDRSLGFSWRR